MVLHFMLHLTEVILLIMSKGILGLFIWRIMNLVRFLEKGKVKIKLHNGNHWLLHEVRHVPRLSRNLISAGQLSDEGCVVIFKDNNWKVSKGSLVVAKGVKVGT